MVAGDEHCQLRAAIEVLVPYTWLSDRAATCFGGRAKATSAAPWSVLSWPTIAVLPLSDRMTDRIPPAPADG